MSPTHRLNAQAHAEKTPALQAVSVDHIGTKLRQSENGLRGLVAWITSAEISPHCGNRKWEAAPGKGSSEAGVARFSER